MSLSGPIPSYQLPALDGLFQQLKTTFAQHVEVEDGASTRLLRVAGLELVVPPGGESAQALLATVCERLAEVAAFGVARALTDTSPQGCSQRMELVSALALLQASMASAPAQGSSSRRAEGAGDLLTTADVAAQLGMSRPYVSMLCDQGKLGEVTRSEGGHRRISKLAVEAYLRTHGNAARANPAP